VIGATTSYGASAKIGGKKTAQKRGTETLLADPRYCSPRYDSKSALWLRGRLLRCVARLHL